LDLNAVLPTVAARALEITHADAVLIYGYDAGNHQFSLTESIGIDKAAEGRLIHRYRQGGRGSPSRHRRHQLAARRSRHHGRADFDPSTHYGTRTSLARCRDRSRLPLGAGGA